jgi:hypothetical protein
MPKKRRNKSAVCLWEDNNSTNTVTTYRRPKEAGPNDLPIGSNHRGEKVQPRYNP